jgi:hypothetical protein
MVNNHELCKKKLKSYLGFSLVTIIKFEVINIKFARDRNISLLLSINQHVFPSILAFFSIHACLVRERERVCFQITTAESAGEPDPEINYFKSFVFVEIS